MPLMVIMFLIPFACLLTSLAALVIILKCAYFSRDVENSSNEDEALLITGCDSGIGLALAKYFHKTTNFKIICGFLQATQSEGYKELKKLSARDQENRLILKQLDITSDGEVDDLMESIAGLMKEGVFKDLIALINNAGVMTYGEFDWLTWRQIQSQIDVNLVGTLRLTRAVMPHIIRSKGRIINVSSVNDATVYPGISVYSATKSALTVFSRGIGYELRKFGVHVITLRLGDFASLTNIMSGHATRRDEMWREMDKRKKSLYRDFFHQFNDHLMKNYGMTSPKKFCDSTLFRDFRRAVLAKNPPTTINCASLGFRAFYFVIEQTPVWIQYQLLDLLIGTVFKWKPPQMDETQSEYL